MTTDHDGRRPLDLDALLELAGVERPAWQRRAACRGQPIDLFFAPRGNRTAGTARAVCESCPVRAECLDHALEHERTHGVWGGMTVRERRHEKRRRRLARTDRAEDVA